MKTSTGTYLFGGIIVALIGFILLALVSGGYLLSVYNDQASLKNHYEMKIKDNESEFDNMWKQISQSSQIADSNKNAFKEVFTAWATGSTPQEGGKMMLWIKQAAPNTKGLYSIYKQVMNIMTGKRDGFTMRQKELVAIAEVYNGNLVTMPKGFFLKLFGFQHIDPLVVTSSRTDNAFKSGKDDDVSLTGQTISPPSPNANTTNN